MTLSAFTPHGAARACPLLVLALTASAAALAQGGGAAMSGASAPDAAWRSCAAMTADSNARLACFDGWAQQQSLGTPVAAGGAPAASAIENAAAPKAQVDTTLPATRVIEVARTEGCRDPQYSELSRFWELESGTDCGTFSFRGYRPISVSVVAASNVDREPTSPAPDHSALQSVPYRRTEGRLQLSVRTKVAQGLLTQGNPTLRDSLWFGYTQQSYWQVFTPQISRPFRTTDHEPEVMYVYPTDAQLPFGWRWRYSGIGLVHQSNGQSEPLSRSWNRAYLMTGIELDSRWRLQAKVWKRIAEDASSDDNPDISDYIGRGELSAFWNATPDSTLGLTVRSSLGSTARGSTRLEWLQALGTGLGGGKSNLRLHTQLFSGYGDSMIDYNHKRTVFSVGLSLVDF
ncbi:phospholipase A [Simplicispira hankyongi]|uniref:Phospholipase A1 n=1 Tax=Simplicispira hankyongi TaxID=2315688 RepID=A0A398CAH8_9BURK|nr:phospholipase A [Simplicispira hankyongi]RID98661.1 phospholipase [Simplicispira hankyongi]